MSHRVVEPGVIEVIYESADEMLPQRQSALRAVLDEQLQGGPVVLVFCVRKVVAVDPSVPAYWLEVTKLLAPRLCGLAIASPSMAVRAAARGFSVGNVLRQVESDVQAFAHEDEALDWAKARRRAQAGS